MKRRPRPIITLGEWRERHGIPQSTANLYVKEGRISAYQSGRVWLVRASEGVPRPGHGGRRPPLSLPEYITLNEWATRRAVNRHTVNTWIRRQQLSDFYRSGDVYLIATAACPPGT